MRYWSILPLLFVGCNLQVREDADIEQTLITLRGIARTGTVIAIQELHEESADQVILAQSLLNSAEITQNALASGHVGGDTLLHFFQDIEPRYVLLMEDVWNLFKLYYQTPSVGDVLSEEQKMFANALLDGIRNGCKTVLMLNNVQVSFDSLPDLHSYVLLRSK